MKNIKSIIFCLSLFAVVASCDPVIAQSAMLPTIPAAATLSPAATATNSVSSNGVTAVYLYTKQTLPYRTAAFQILATRVSTAMNGKALIEGSVDGLNYFSLSASDSIHIADGVTYPGDRAIIINTTSTAYPNGGLHYPYYRLKLTQIAGDTATVKAWVNFRQ